MTGQRSREKERLRIRSAAHLRMLADVQGCTHRKIAAVVFQSDAHSHVSRILRGNVRTIGRDAAQRWAQLHGVSVEDLFMPATSNNTGRTVRGAA